MEKFESNLLNKLLDKYESSKLSKGGSLIKLKIKIDKSAKEFADYYRADSYNYVDNHNLTLKKLEKLCYIKVNYDDEQLDSVELNLDNVLNLYDYLKRENPKLELKKVEKYINDFDFSNTFLASFIDYIRKNIAEKYDYPKKYFKDSNELLLILKSFKGIFEIKEEMMMRDFSVKYLNDSKIFDHIKGKIIRIIRDFTNVEYSEDDDVLADYNIIKNSTYTLIKNNLIFKLKNQVISLNDLEFEFSLSDSMIKELQILDCKIDTVITVENLTSFYALDRKDALVIYLAGFHNHTKQLLLTKIYEAYPHANYYHFGDIDAGGFWIFKSLVDKTKIEFKPYRMSVNELEENTDNLKELTENDRIRLKLMLNSKKFNIFSDVIEYMLENNVKLEQEILD